MTPIRIATVVAAAAVATGCVSLSRSAAVAPLDAERAQDGRVDEVVLLNAPSTVSDEFETIFRQRVKARLDGCAAGRRALRLEASVERLTRTHPVITAVVAGANVLRGTARLVDAETGQPAGEYQIGRTVVGGRVGAIAMAQSEEQLSDAFGAELCKQAFAPDGATRREAAPPPAAPTLVAPPEAAPAPAPVSPDPVDPAATPEAQPPAAAPGAAPVPG